MREDVVGDAEALGSISAAFPNLVLRSSSKSFFRRVSLG